MAENVKVAVRVRPFNKTEAEENAKCILQIDGSSVLVTNPEGLENKRFSFDYCFWSLPVELNGATTSPPKKCAGQGDIFHDLGAECLKAAWQGYNVCVFTYGQTGSGKSYTLFGTAYENSGLIFHCCYELFRMTSAATAAGRGSSYQLEISFMEIYNERIRDLLNPRKETRPLRVRESRMIGTYVEGLTRELAVSYPDVEKILHHASVLRALATTNANAQSSRAHAIVTFYFKQLTRDMYKQRDNEMSAKITFFDLAGSEALEPSHQPPANDRMRESYAINRSLNSLSQVINALAEKKRIVPYKESVLTRLMADALGGNARTYMIATVSPASTAYEVTLSTLVCAEKVRRIPNHAIINDSTHSKKIQKTLEAELSKLTTRLRARGPASNAHKGNSAASSTNGSICSGADSTASRNSTVPLSFEEREEIKKEISQLQHLLSELTVTWEQRLKKKQILFHQREMALKSIGLYVRETTAGAPTNGVVVPPSGVVSPAVGGAAAASAMVELGSVPYLVNLNEDQLLSELLVFPIWKGETVVTAERAAVAAPQATNGVASELNIEDNDESSPAASANSETSPNDYETSSRQRKRRILLGGLAIGRDHCTFENRGRRKAVMLYQSRTAQGDFEEPTERYAATYVNGRIIESSDGIPLSHGDRVILGIYHVFLYCNTAAIAGNASIGLTASTDSSKQSISSSAGAASPSPTLARRMSTRLGSTRPSQENVMLAVRDWEFAVREVISAQGLLPNVVDSEETDRIRDVQVHLEHLQEQIEQQRQHAEEQLQRHKKQYERKERKLQTEKEQLQMRLQLKLEKEEVSEILRNLEQLDEQIRVSREEAQLATSMIRQELEASTRRLEEALRKQRQRATFLAQRLEKQKREKTVFYYKLLRVHIMLLEANAIANELQRNVKFALELQASQYGGSALSKIPEITIKVVDDLRHEVFVWPYEKFVLRLCAMRQLLEDLFTPAAARDGTAQAGEEEEGDPFFDPKGTSQHSALAALQSVGVDGGPISLPSVVLAAAASPERSSRTLSTPSPAAIRRHGSAGQFPSSPLRSSTAGGIQKESQGEGRSSNDVTKPSAISPIPPIIGPTGRSSSTPLVELTAPLVGQRRTQREGSIELSIDDVGKDPSFTAIVSNSIDAARSAAAVFGLDNDPDETIREIKREQNKLSRRALRLLLKQRQAYEQKLISLALEKQALEQKHRELVRTLEGQMRRSKVCLLF